MKREYNAAEGYSKSSVPGNWNRSTDFQFKDLTQVKYAPYDAVNNFFRRSVIVNLKFDIWSKSTINTISRLAEQGEMFPRSRIEWK